MYLLTIILSLLKFTFPVKFLKWNEQFRKTLKLIMHAVIMLETDAQRRVCLFTGFSLH